MFMFQLCSTHHQLSPGTNIEPNSKVDFFTIGTIRVRINGGRGGLKIFRSGSNFFWALSMPRSITGLMSSMIREKSGILGHPIVYTGKQTPGWVDLECTSNAPSVYLRLGLSCTSTSTYPLIVSGLVCTYISLPILSTIRP